MHGEYRFGHPMVAAACLNGRVRPAREWVASIRFATWGRPNLGRRPGCSISEVKRWLGHSASSAMADVYMKPVSPENRAVVEWVRKCLQSGKVDLRLAKGRKKPKPK